MRSLSKRYTVEIKFSEFFYDFYFSVITDFFFPIFRWEFPEYINLDSVKQPLLLVKHGQTLSDHGNKFGPLLYMRTKTFIFKFRFNFNYLIFKFDLIHYQKHKNIIFKINFSYNLYIY